MKVINDIIHYLNILYNEYDKSNLNPDKVEISSGLELDLDSKISNVIPINPIKFNLLPLNLSNSFQNIFIIYFVYQILNISMK